MLLAFSPLGIIAAVVKFVPQLVQSVQWLWAHKDDPNMVKNAHAQMGHTILPQILSGVQGFSSAIGSTVSSLVNQVVQLNEAVLGLLGGITGVPLLSAAQSIVQALSNGVKELVNWGQESFQAAAKGVQEAFVKIKTKIEPYAGVLSSLAVAIANPAMIPVILAGSAWQILDDCYKLPIIDFLLDIVIGLLEAAPSLPMFGPLWPMLKAGVVGFLKGVKGQPAATKVAITNKLAKIISGGSPAFMIGFVKGLLKGIWEGLTDPFVLMYEGIKGLGNLITWLNDTANEALSPQPSPTTAQKAEASAAPTVDKVAIGQTLQQMGQELQPPATQVTEGFMPAIKAAFSGGEGLTFESLKQKLGEAWAAVESAITNAGGQLAQKVCEFMMQDTAEGQMGETVGWLAGTIAFEVALAILTAGSATAAKGAMKVLQTFAKILDWTGEALGLAFKGLAKLGGFVLDIVKGIGKLLSHAGGAAKTVLGALGEIGEKLIKYASELLGKIGKSPAGEVVEEGAQKATKETLEAGAEKGAKEGVEVGAEQTTKEVVKEGTEQTTDVMARHSGGRAGIHEFGWRKKLDENYELSWEEFQKQVEKIRLDLLSRNDVNRVKNTLHDFGIPVDEQLIAAVKRYNFDSSGIAFTTDNYNAWTKLASGKGTIDDARYLIHEMAEVSELQRIQRETGFDFMGVNLENMSRRERQQWSADFDRNYMQAHCKALETEYDFIAQQVFVATNGRVQISKTVAAAVDPSRNEARRYMLVSGVPLEKHYNFDAWQQRANEVVEIGRGTRDKLGLRQQNLTLAELVNAVKRLKLQ